MNRCDQQRVQKFHRLFVESWELRSSVNIPFDLAGNGEDMAITVLTNVVKE